MISIVALDRLSVDLRHSPALTSVPATMLGLALLACDTGVEGVGAERAPLVTIQGIVRNDTNVVLPESNLRIGILWTGVHRFVPFCHAFGPTVADPMRAVTLVASAACRDPFEVVPAWAGASVPWFEAEPTGRFELSLFEPPPAEVLVGTPGARVAYGSIVLFHDRDGDARLDLAKPCLLTETEHEEPEEIWAASFARLNVAQNRVVYVEGTFDRESFHYPPPPGCVVFPEAGFSIWRVGDYLFPSSSCSVHPVDDPVVILAGSAALNRNLACRQSDEEVFPRPPNSEDSNSASVVAQCASDGSLAAYDLDCHCPGIRVYRLSGCFDAVDCADPDWDLRDKPPENWECF